VRFASVYQQFKTIEELIDEARAVMDARRFEDDPTQGMLFVEPGLAAKNGDAADAHSPLPQKRRSRKATVSSLGEGEAPAEPER